ncbi:MAG: hypothetical protein Q6363_001900 [Candidatus Njordarchaeota archaeon]
MKTATWLLNYGLPVGIALLIISMLIYIYLYGRMIRTLKRITLKYLFMIIANSYIFAFGLFCILVSNGII